jgi:hypothetical protein
MLDSSKNVSCERSQDKPGFQGEKAMRKRIYLAVVAVVIAAAVGGVALLRLGGVAQASSGGHYDGTFTFPDSLCGFDGTTTLFVRDNFGTPVHGGSYDSGQLRQTFVADNGRGVVIMVDAGRLVFDPPIANPDGTTTFIFHSTGQDNKTQALNGPVLEQSTGNAVFTEVVDANGNIVSFSAVSTGQGNNLTGLPDCSVVGPYLAGA